MNNPALMELAACPCCDSPAVVQRSHGRDCSETWIACTKCPMQTWREAWMGNDDAIVSVLRYAWNRRTQLRTAAAEGGDLMVIDGEPENPPVIVAEFGEGGLVVSHGVTSEEGWPFVTIRTSIDFGEVGQPVEDNNKGPIRMLMYFPTHDQAIRVHHALTNVADKPTDSGAGRDGERLDWLERQHVEVRKPARYGSFAKFHASPDEEGEPSDLRQRIDTAIAGAAGERD